jgi:tetratricopeptide (TPR) repeat protein
VEKTTDGLGEILINMNSVLTKGEISRAIKNYRQAIMVNPDDPEAHFRLGISSLLLKDRQAALEEYRVLKNLDHRMADELLQSWNIRTPWS